jgi:hypothetical protein
MLIPTASYFVVAHARMRLELRSTGYGKYALGPINFPIALAFGEKDCWSETMKARARPNISARMGLRLNVELH